MEKSHPTRDTKECWQKQHSETSMKEKFIIKGTPKRIGMREVRALLWATDFVLGFMGFSYNVQQVKIKFVNRKRTWPDSNWAADVHRKTAEIRLTNDYLFSATATLIIHELFHLYADNGHEYEVSTFVSKIKADIIEAANHAIKNGQKWAAYRAHLLISYRGNNENSDEYNDEQYTKNIKTLKVESTDDIKCIKVS